MNANANVANNGMSNANQPKAAAELKGLDYVLANKSGLAGESDKVFNSLVKAFNAELAERKTFNGMHALLLQCAKGDKVVYNLVNSKEFKKSMRKSLPHLTVVKTDGDGKVVEEYVILCKVGVRQPNTPTLDLDACKKFSTAISDKISLNSLSLVEYFDGIDRIDTTDFAALAIERTHTVTDKQVVTLADGSKSAPQPVYVYTKDADGNDKKVVLTKSQSDVFYPTLNENVTPKAFKEALKAALVDMWVMIFPQTEKTAE